MVNPHGAVADLIERVCHMRGGAKALTDRIDLSYSQIRRMAGDGSIPNLEQILQFAELAGDRDRFRPELIERLSSMFERSPDEIAEVIAARVDAGEDLRSAIREELWASAR